MNQDAFEIQMREHNRCVLRRDNQDWEREFSHVQEALDFASRLPGGRDARLTVYDEKGVRFMQVVL